MRVELTEAERETLYRAAGWRSDTPERFDAAVGRVIRSRLTEQREQIAQAIEAAFGLDGTGMRPRPLTPDAQTKTDFASDPVWAAMIARGDA